MVYNSLTRSKVRFIPKDAKKVIWYQCGPTVYSDSHIGHARTYVALDAIRRICKEYLNYNIILCQNITDIDDKIITRSSERKIPFTELTAQMEADYVNDMACLGVQLPDIVTRVSVRMRTLPLHMSLLLGDFNNHVHCSHCCNDLTSAYILLLA